MSKATRPKGDRAGLVSGFEHPVPTPARLKILSVPPAVCRRSSTTVGRSDLGDAGLNRLLKKGLACR
jgi:hypothetical protein